MPHIQIYERKDGQDINEYIKTVSVIEIDKRNCVMIEVTDDNGDNYFVPVPTEQFSEFVRKCQQMKATLS